MYPDDFVFFPPHILIDDGHADHLKGALYARDPSQCAKAPEAVHKVMVLRV